MRQGTKYISQQGSEHGHFVVASGEVKSPATVLAGNFCHSFTNMIISHMVSGTLVVA